MNIQSITKEPIEIESIPKFEEKYKVVFSANYKSINIDIYRCPIHNNEFFITASALGVCLPILYWINDIDVGIEDILKEIYRDFCTFVIAVRNTENETQH